MTSHTEPTEIAVQRPLAVVFPGQGAQRAGMGADLHERFELARRIFAEASDAIRVDIPKLCFGDDPRIDQTDLTQPCLLTVEYAAYRVAVEEYGLEATLFGGHSLGEYTALLAAGVLPLAVAVSLVHARGGLMQEASRAGPGGMAALILDSIESSGAAQIVESLGAEVANRNSPSQIAISGTIANLERVRAALLLELPDLDYAPLKVSAPFHSRFMRPVVERLRERLEAVQSSFRLERATHVTSNLTGGLHDPDRLVYNLAEQVAAPVRWRENMAILSERAGRIVEFGPRGSLSKFFRATGVVATPITCVADFDTHLAVQALATTDTARRPPSPSASAVLRSLDPAHDTARAARYLIGGMGRGIGSAPLVIRAARAGVLAFLGSSGTPCNQVERELLHVRAALPGDALWGLNITQDVRDPARAEQLVELAVRNAVPALEVAGFPAPTAALVRARLAGARRSADGRPCAARHVVVKVSDEGVARRFLAPPPPGLVTGLVATGQLTHDEAEMAGMIAMADDLCAAAGWGEDPTFPAQLFLPELAALVRECAPRGAPYPCQRVGLAGGLGSPESVAAAFAAGADFVLTGSVNLCTVEAGLRDEAKALLSAARLHDFALAPDVERFELGGRVPVLRRGLTFAARAETLDLLWRRFGSLAAMPREERERFVALALGSRQACDAVHTDRPVDAASHFRGWLECTLERAHRDHPAALDDVQIQSGPAIAAFNRAVRNSPLADWRKRHVDDVARFLMDGAARLRAVQNTA